MSQKNEFHMGIGRVGDVTLRYARKMRWTISFSHLTSDNNTKNVGSYFIHMAARPQISFEEAEVHFLHERIYLAGKPQYEAINMTIYDVAENSEVARWMYEVYKFGKHGRSGPMSETQWYKWNGYLTMWDGEGAKLQEWLLYGCWPTTVNYGDLDMSSSDVAPIEVTLRYDSMDLIYDLDVVTTGNLAPYPPGAEGVNFSSVVEMPGSASAPAL